MSLTDTLLEPPSTLSPDDMIAAVSRLAAAELASQVVAIDEGAYPGDLMRKFGSVGAWGLHTGADVNLGAAIDAMAVISETCMATGFMAWCQDTLAWYVLNSDNKDLKARFLNDVAAGRALGGTALSNPMKAFCGIENVRLKGTRVEGGYVVKGLLPWVSNLGPDHLFGAIFEVAGAPCKHVMCLVDCAEAAVTLKPSEPFMAMDGTGTYAVQVRDLFVPDAMVIADPAQPYVEKIRGGFMLLQTGMAIGLIRDCIRMMEEVRPSLGHVNKYLEVQPEDLTAALRDAEAEIMELVKTPYDPSPDYWRRVLAVRLAGGEACLLAAQAALLHCGARGYVMAHRSQRRLREALFVAIVTPATKQLKLMLAELAA